MFSFQFPNIFWSILLLVLKDVLFERFFLVVLTVVVVVIVDFRFYQSKFFIPHGNEILKWFGVFTLFLLIEDAETIELLIKNCFRKFFLEFSHLRLKSWEVLLHLIRVVVESSVIKGSMIKQGKWATVVLEYQFKNIIQDLIGLHWSLQKGLNYTR